MEQTNSRVRETAYTAKNITTYLLFWLLVVFIPVGWIIWTAQKHWKTEDIACDQLAKRYGASHMLEQPHDSRARRSTCIGVMPDGTLREFYN